MFDQCVKMHDAHIPLLVSQIITLLSTDPEINLVPLGDHAKSYTSSIWPLKKHKESSQWHGHLS